MGISLLANGQNGQNVRVDDGDAALALDVGAAVASSSLTSATKASCRYRNGGCCPSSLTVKMAKNHFDHVVCAYVHLEIHVYAFYGCVGMSYSIRKVLD